MINIIVSPIYAATIRAAIEEAELVIDHQEVKDSLYINKHIQQNLRSYGAANMLLIDLQAALDNDDEIIQALESVRMMYTGMKVIILAAGRQAGDVLLSRIFGLGIWDIISTEDYKEIREQLYHSLTVGNTFADAIGYKDVKSAGQLVVKNEIKQVVNKVVLAFAGASTRIGTTHVSLIAANYLRKAGYNVALVEYNRRPAYESIARDFDAKKLGNHFPLAGIDYYPEATEATLSSVIGMSYNFILADFGDFGAADLVTFNKAAVRFLVCGSKPWEIDYLNEIFETVPPETLKQYHYCFNFALETQQATIREGMTYLSNGKNIHFLPLVADPFNSSDFPDASVILEEYLPIQVEEPKKRRGSAFWKRK